MRKYLYGLVGVFVLAGSADAVEGANWDFSILNLQNSERVEISYQSRGCFHNTASSLVIEGEYAYTISHSSSGEKSEGISTKHELSWKEKEGLDRYLKRIAAGTGTGCTTTDTIQLVFKRNGKTISEHSMIDGSCSRASDEYTVSALLWNISKEQEASVWTDR